LIFDSKRISQIMGIGMRTAQRRLNELPEGEDLFFLVGRSRVATEAGLEYIKKWRRHKPVKK
jgi:hypothetical protein